MERIRDVTAPRGFSRWLYRLPIALYRLGLGRLFGGRFLLLVHTGRRSGLPRRAVLEVVRRDSETGVTYVSSGFGEHSDWFRNLVKNPRASIEVGGRRLEVEARVLELSEAEREILDYARRSPRAVKAVARFCGYAIDGSDEDLRAFARVLKLVALVPDSRR